jgi:hypothetical protein
MVFFSVNPFYKFYAHCQASGNKQRNSLTLRVHQRHVIPPSVSIHSSPNTVKHRQEATTFDVC